STRDTPFERRQTRAMRFETTRLSPFTRPVADRGQPTREASRRTPAPHDPLKYRLGLEGASNRPAFVQEERVFAPLSVDDAIEMRARAVAITDAIGGGGGGGNRGRGRAGAGTGKKTGTGTGTGTGKRTENGDGDGDGDGHGHGHGHGRRRAALILPRVPCGALLFSSPFASSASS